MCRLWPMSVAATRGIIGQRLGATGTHIVLTAIKAWAKQLPYPVLLRGYYLYCALRYWPAYRRRRRQARLPLLSEIDLARYRTSDTLFVLASGPSINRIAPERWQAIARANSVGFNFWLFHPFVPTFYFSECTSPWIRPGAQDPIGEYNEYLDSLLLQTRARAAEYRDVPKIVMDLVQASGAPDLDRLAAEFRHNLFAAITVPLVARSDEEFAHGLRYLLRKGAFRPASRIEYLFKHCATLSTTVTFGARLGYRRIVLCGVDLSNEERFYHDEEHFPEDSGKQFYRDQRGTGQKHVLLSRYAWGTTPIDVVLRDMRSLVLAPAGIELYVENPHSELAGDLPVAPQSLFDEINARALSPQPAAGAATPA